MDRNEALAKFEDILQIVEMWAEEDIANGAVMDSGGFESAVVENDYNNPIVTIWNYYKYLTGAEDTEWS